MKINLTQSVIIGFIIIVIGSIGMKISNNLRPSKYDDFAKCLTKAGFVKYGTNSCPFCQKQKAMFGNAFKYINYVQCDIDTQTCIDEGIEGYPTWKIHTDETSENIGSGVKPLTVLAELSNCELPE